MPDVSRDGPPLGARQAGRAVPEDDRQACNRTQLGNQFACGTSRAPALQWASRHRGRVGCELGKGEGGTQMDPRDAERGVWRGPRAHRAYRTARA